MLTNRAGLGSTGIPTVCVSIPPSEGTDPAHHPARHRRWADVNAALRTWASSTASMCTYMEFPVPMTHPFDAETAGLWEPDGLHLTPAGSERVVAALAPVVQNALLLGGGRDTSTLTQASL